MSRYSFTSGDDRWHVGWDPAVASYYAQVEPVRTAPGAEDAQALRTVAGDRVGEVPTLAALDVRLAGRVQMPAGVRDQLADDGPARPDVAAQRATSRLGAAERLAGLEERELSQRAAAWAALSGRATTSSGPAGPGRDKPAGDRSAEQEARRREAAHREDDARRQDHDRGPRL